MLPEVIVYCYYCYFLVSNWIQIGIFTMQMDSDVLDSFISRN